MVPELCQTISRAHTAVGSCCHQRSFCTSARATAPYCFLRGPRSHTALLPPVSGNEACRLIAGRWYVPIAQYGLRLQYQTGRGSHRRLRSPNARGLWFGVRSSSPGIAHGWQHEEACDLHMGDPTCRGGQGASETLRSKSSLR